ncbi:hypothetical protein V2J94_41535 [Streptomyces sp. DSM 41524]|uniref:Uncharacterized protein n=1 Tax=Streptomyces asiaticus subsp. ignotus TaxID=3098222 RepID=A0ABU7QC95_9ACTN|nr:hypothetical protein [Streptomyces sp. DSM 41524]
MLPDFIQIEPYRHDLGHQAWAARCWGNGTCDGWVSVDHDTEQWARTAVRRHLAEDHPDTGPDSRTDNTDSSGPMTMRCSRAVLEGLGAPGEHDAHAWTPQPGMPAVWCPGTPNRPDSLDNKQDGGVDTDTDTPTTSVDADRTSPDAAPDDALREQYAATLRDFPIALWTPEALADRILSIRDRRMEQITNRLIYAGHVAADERGRAYNAEQRAEEAEAAITRVRRLVEHWQSTVRPGEYHPATRAVFAALDGAPVEPHPAEAERDAAYRERAHLLAWISALHPANAVITPAADIDEPGWQLLFLLVGGWQMSWHIHPRDAELFAHVEQVEPTDPRAQWDGHSTDAKYQRIQEHTRRLSQADTTKER